MPTMFAVVLYHWLYFCPQLGVVVPTHALTLPEEPITGPGEYWCDVTVSPWLSKCKQYSYMIILHFWDWMVSGRTCYLNSVWSLRWMEWTRSGCPCLWCRMWSPANFCWWRSNKSKNSPIQNSVLFAECNLENIHKEFVQIKWLFISSRVVFILWPTSVFF